MNNVCFNGKLLPADTPLLRADNKGYPPNGGWPFYFIFNE